MRDVNIKLIDKLAKQSSKLFITFVVEYFQDLELGDDEAINLLYKTLTVNSDDTQLNDKDVYRLLRHYSTDICDKAFECVRAYLMLDINKNYSLDETFKNSDSECLKVVVRAFVLDMVDRVKTESNINDDLTLLSNIEQSLSNISLDLSRSLVDVYFDHIVYFGNKKLVNQIKSNSVLRSAASNSLSRT